MEMSKTALQIAGYSAVQIIQDELAAGFAANGPFDRILLLGSIDALPDTLSEQLAENGRLVVVIGEGRTGKAYLYRRVSGHFSGHAVFDVALPPLPGFVSQKKFEFSL